MRLDILNDVRKVGLSAITKLTRITPSSGIVQERCQAQMTVGGKPDIRCRQLPPPAISGHKHVAHYQSNSNSPEHKGPTPERAIADCTSPNEKVYTPSRYRIYSGPSPRMENKNG